MNLFVRLAPVLLVGSLACSTIDHGYAFRSYDAKGDDAVKRIAVAAWASPSYPEVGELIARIATDYVKLRKNYLVHDPVAMKRDFGEACGELQGVLALRALDIQVEGDEVKARMAAELYRCQDGQLLWRVEGKKVVDSNDADLQNLAGTYQSQVGESAKKFAAPMFALVQGLLGELPDPVLNDEEVLEKIELGRYEAPSFFDNLLAFTFRG